MLFRATIALFALFLTLPSTSSAAGKGSEITVVGPTENNAAFIAVRPVAMPMQPEIVAVPGTMTTGTPAAEVPQPQIQTIPTGMPAVQEPQPQVQTMLPQPVAEEPMLVLVMEPIEEEPAVQEMQPGLMTTGTPHVTTAEPQMQAGRGEETMRGPMRGTSSERTGRGMRMRGRRLQRRAAGRLLAATPTVTTPQKQMVERPTMERPTMERPTMERPTMERPTMERPTMERTTEEHPTEERPTMERPTEERPTTPETGISGARFNTVFNTVIGELELSPEMFGAQSATPESPTRIGGGRGQESQWELVWMPRGATSIL